MSKTCTHEERILLILAQETDSLYSNQVASAIRAGGYLHALKTCKMPNPSEYSHPDQFRRDYLISSYLSKFEGYEDTGKLESEAVSSFLRTEADVGVVNRHLRYGSACNGVEGIISDARRKIIRILDPLANSGDNFPFKEFITGCDWGPGATSSLKSNDARLDKKILEHQLSVTRHALPYAIAYMQYDTSWVSARFGFPVESCSLLPCEFQIVDSDRFTTVPKNWKTRRSIAIQPTLNIFLQKGVGRVIRNRLRRDGVNLDDQSRNQILASRAFSEGYATIDLAKASDSVSSELVELLMPPSWLKVMKDLRTRYTKIGDHVHWLEKFSAMGNGFTFELESLIFYALLWGVVRCEANDWDSEIAVYGDDLIVHSKYYERVVQVLSYCGFTVNDEKSFHSGPFYESCGKHYFMGFDVTPVYQKKRVNCLPEAIRCANRLFRWGVYDSFIDLRIRTAWEVCASYADRFIEPQLRKKLRFVPRVPWWIEGDDGLLVPDFQYKLRNHIQRIKVIAFTPRKVGADGYSLLSHCLRKGVVTDSPFNGLLSLRGIGKYRYATREVTCSRTDVLSWV
jgi:hypothetical protein